MTVHDDPQRTPVYLLESDLKTAKRVLDLVASRNSRSLLRPSTAQGQGQPRSNPPLSTFKPYLVFVPKLLQSIRGLIEEEGMVDEVKTFEFMWELIPLDANLLSLELPYAAEKLRTHQIRTVVKSLQVRDLTAKEKSVKACRVRSELFFR